MQTRIEQAQTEIETLASQRDALQHLQEVVRAPVFTDDERGAVADALDTCLRTLVDREEFVRQNQYFFTEEVRECTHLLEERERLLNVAFSTQTMREHQQLMRLFEAEHTHLRARLREASQ